MPEQSDPAAAVVNTGPLIALGACDRLDILPLLHAPVVTPQAVVDELRRGQPDAAFSSGDLFPPPTWLEIRALRQAPSPLLLAHLDQGEAAVIGLALDLGIPQVIIDERRGRLVG